MAEHIITESAAPHSVELTSNAKGKIQCVVKVYDADPAKAAEKALEVMKSTRLALGDQLAQG